MGGRLIVIEGGDGVGKTTLIASLAKHLEARGLRPLVLREPGGSTLGERIRMMLKDGENPPCSRAEALLFAASRAQLAEEVIKPALVDGRWVLLDRFITSSLAYQGVGRGLGIEPVRSLSEFALNGLTADRTLLLTLSPAEAARRLQRRGKILDRFDAAGLDFHTLVENSYRALAADDPAIVSVDADGAPEMVFAAALVALDDLVGTPVS
jgi:dTMP kinase